MVGEIVIGGLVVYALSKIAGGRGNPGGAAIRGRGDVYRTRDGRADYRFSFERQRDGSWRAYILRQPSYISRDDGAHATHRLSDGARRYVCWTGALRSENEARHVATRWAEATQDYIRTGRRF